MQHFRVISAVCYYFHYVFTNIVARFENLVYSRNEYYFYSSKQLPLIYILFIKKQFILFMKKQLIGIFGVAALATSSFAAQITIIDELDGTTAGTSLTSAGLSRTSVGWHKTSGSAWGFGTGNT